ncbi:MAG TPA: amidase [Thermoanaerobaculia bacterium]|nr:amidase [Thermoanaerobaculia bacterium]
MLGGAPARAASPHPRVGPFEELEEATIAELQAGMAAGDFSALDLVNMYLDRIEAIDVDGPALNSIIEVNPDARRLAAQRDSERAAGDVRGPLHGIPFVIKDNIDSGDQMMTTAGSLALVGAPARLDARALWKLRRAGAVLLGKAGLSEWANFRGFDSSSGWSARGGQVRNPYIVDRNPCGSSSGSAAAVSANLAAFALGTETDGSVVCPASACGVVGIKPTVGLVSRSGVVPIAAAQDTIGPMGRTVADAAAVLGAMTGGDLADPATFPSGGNFFKDYTQFLDPNGLAGARIGVLRGGILGGSAEAEAVYEQALEAMSNAGATLVDPADPPSTAEFHNDISELIVLIFEFKRDLNAYLATRTGVPVSTMADVIQFNLDHAAEELLYFGQEWFLLSEFELFTEAEYQQALETGPRLAGRDGIDAILDGEGLDALVAFTNSPAWPNDLINGDHFLTASSHWAAVSGYANITVPGGFSFGLPVGINFIGRRWSEPTLIKLASGFEAATQARMAPQFLPTHELPVGELDLNAHRLAASARRLERLLRAKPMAAKVLERRPRFL